MCKLTLRFTEERSALCIWLLAYCDRTEALSPWVSPAETFHLYRMSEMTDLAYSDFLLAFFRAKLVMDYRSPKQQG